MVSKCCYWRVHCYLYLKLWMFCLLRKAFVSHLFLALCELILHIHTVILRKFWVCLICLILYNIHLALCKGYFWPNFLNSCLNFRPILMLIWEEVGFTWMLGMASFRYTLNSYLPLMVFVMLILQKFNDLL